MPDEAFVVVARVAKTHGLKGEVSVAPVTETSFSLFEGVPVWFIPPVLAVRSSRVVSTRPGPKGVLVSFEGVGDIDTARTLVGREVLVDARHLPDGWEVEEYDSLEGYRVVDDVHGELGSIVETIETGANDVWVIEGAYGEVLIPVIDDVVLDINDDAQLVSVHLLAGLLPGEDDGA